MNIMRIKTLWKEHRLALILAISFAICLIFALVLYADEMKSRQAESVFQTEFERIRMPSGTVEQSYHKHHKLGSYRISLEGEFSSELSDIEIINYYNEEFAIQGWKQEVSRLGHYCKRGYAATFEFDCQNCGTYKLILSQGLDKDCGGISMLGLLFRFGIGCFFLVNGVSQTRTVLRKPGALEQPVTYRNLNVLNGFLQSVLGIMILLGVIYGLWLYVAPR
jgi:hypothetical protein